MNSIVNRIAMMCVLAVLMITACAKPSEPVKTYPMRGEVMGVDPGGHVATIKHEAIPGFMGAMTMGYPVKDASELSKMSVGEQITATVYSKGDDFWVGDVRKAK